MNVELLTEVAEWLEAGAPRVVLDNGNVVNAFNINRVQFETERGAICCIAGYAALLENKYISGFNYVDYAHEAFGISEEQAFALCDPDRIGFTPTAKQAGHTVRRLIETGEVVWDGEKR